MSSVVFVHGTGVREPHYSELLAEVRRGFVTERPDITVVPCSWGERFGARLNAAGASLPGVENGAPLPAVTDGVEAVRDAGSDIRVWQALDIDPLLELRLLSWDNGRGGPRPPDPGALAKRLRALSSDVELAEELRGLGLTEAFDSAVDRLLTSDVHELLARCRFDDDLWGALARSLTAATMSIGDRLTAPLDGAARRRLVTVVRRALGGSDRGLLGRVGRFAYTVAMGLGGSQLLGRRRVPMTENHHGVPGDIVLYLSRGQRIRRHVADVVARAEPPVTVLAHSLGGLICADALVTGEMSGVDLLVTVGAQVPHFYEMDAMPTLPFGQRLPAHYPDWINVYDARDLLSFVGAAVFPDRVEDVAVDNDQPFPRSHSSYWRNRRLYELLSPRIP